MANGQATDATPPAAAGAAQAVDLAAAAKIFQKSCRACHGNKGQGASSYPKLSDKEPAYIADKLERYRAGEKFGPNSVLMIQHAKKLSDADIASLSVYVATAFD
jgi:cytochrome c553